VLAHSAVTGPAGWQYRSPGSPDPYMCSCLFWPFWFNRDAPALSSVPELSADGTLAAARMCASPGLRTGRSRARDPYPLRRGAVAHGL